MCGGNIKNRQTVIVSKNLGVSTEWKENLGFCGDFDEVIVRNVAHSPLQGSSSTSLGSYIVWANFISSPTNFLCVATNNSASNPNTVLKMKENTNSDVQFKIYTRQALDAIDVVSSATLSGVLYLTLEFIQYEKKLI